MFRVSVSVEWMQDGIDDYYLVKLCDMLVTRHSPLDILCRIEQG